MHFSSISSTFVVILIALFIGMVLCLVIILLNGPTMGLSLLMTHATYDLILARHTAFGFAGIMASQEIPKISSIQTRGMNGEKLWGFPGGAKDFSCKRETIADTESGMGLEQEIGQFIHGKVQ